LGGGKALRLQALEKPLVEKVAMVQCANRQTDRRHTMPRGNKKRTKPRRVPVIKVGLVHHGNKDMKKGNDCTAKNAGRTQTHLKGKERIRLQGAASQGADAAQRAKRSKEKGQRRGRDKRTQGRRRQRCFRINTNQGEEKKR